MIKRALISVYDKNNVLELCSFLKENNVEIISTGGTYKYLLENNIPVTEISKVTGFEEILDGRVKTLHPNIHGGILAVRNNEEHMKTIKKKGIDTIDMVVVNLYPFFNKVNEDISFDEKVEFIDIGGPTMIRAAAKNFQDVIVLTDSDDYNDIMEQLKENGEVYYATKKRLAAKVFNLMSAYDGAIANFLFEDEKYPEYLSLSYKKQCDLRYGENPHQKSSYYVSTCNNGAMKDFTQLNGKEISYNNIKDMDIAWKVVCEFDETACCAVKHNTPCGVAIGTNVFDAYKKTYHCDEISIFGGIVAFNKTVDEATAIELKKIFLEIVIAPDFDAAALEILKSKKNLRVIKAIYKPENNIEISMVDGGILVQDKDNQLINDIKIVTNSKPSKEKIDEALFGMKIAKYVKSNAIVIINNYAAIGIAGGQVNRIWAATEALERASKKENNLQSLENAVFVSDAFFPFKDVVEEANKYGIKTIIQPGGSINDDKSIEECNKLDIAMIFTGIRHFKH